MGCCGGRRSEAGMVHAGPGTADAPAARFADMQTILFEYAGRTSLSAQGPVTGVRYQFSNPGKQLAVDARDAPYLAGVPNLTRVRREP